MPRVKKIGISISIYNISRGKAQRRNNKASLWSGDSPSRKSQQRRNAVSNPASFVPYISVYGLSRPCDILLYYIIIFV